MEHSREHGSVSIIVELDLPFHVESGLGSEVLITGQRSRIESAQQDVLASLGTRSVSRVITYSSIPYLALTVDEEALLFLANQAGVKAIFEDRIVTPILDESIELIGAPGAWTAGYTGAGYAVAVLDTGTDLSHPFLADRTVAEACYSSGQHSLCPTGEPSEVGDGASQPTNCEGQCSHGSHVAGIALGHSDVLSGVAPDASSK